jgi:hypothetical protein
LTWKWVFGYCRIWSINSAHDPLIQEQEAAAMAVRIGFLLLAFLACVQPVFAEGITNGNFEIGDLSGWDTRSNASNSSCHGWESVDVTAGNHYAVLDAYAQTQWSQDPFTGEWLSTPGSAFASISQLVKVAVGDKVTFNYTCDTTGDESVISIWRQDNSFLDSVSLSSSEEWVSRSYTFKSAGSLYIEFSTELKSAGSALVKIDNVQLVPAPEPGTFVLLTIGAVICGAFARFRRK